MAKKTPRNPHGLSPNQLDLLSMMLDGAWVAYAWRDAPTKSGVRCAAVMVFPASYEGRKLLLNRIEPTAEALRKRGLVRWRGHDADLYELTDEGREAALKRRFMTPRYAETGQVHEIKLRQALFDDVAKQRKRAEIRKNDRDYRRGDILHMRCWTGAQYNGNEVVVEVTHVAKGENVKGIEDGYAVLSTSLCYIKSVNTAFTAPVTVFHWKGRSF